MPTLSPRTAAELAEILAEKAALKQVIRLAGSCTKDAMAGPLPASGITISTTGLNQVLNYEPRDLTISVQAGMRWADLTALLASNRQMIPLDPPFASRATVGGVIASNTCGPRRRLFGTARDVVIGMQFATCQGKIVQSGGMVVKNVAGLDMSKLMIGSFGTLAAICSVNFKLAPMPAGTLTFFQSFPSLSEALTARDLLHKGPLQPMALDLLNPKASEVLALEGWTILTQVAGNRSVLTRCTRELDGWESLDGAAEENLWRAIREWTPAWLSRHPEATVVRVCGTLTGLGEILGTVDEVAIARAGTGTVYVYFPGAPDRALLPRDGPKAVVEFSPPSTKSTPDALWPSTPPDFAIMERVKNLFDPDRLLNPGRMYGRL